MNNIRKYSSSDLDNITEIWNEIIDEGESFFWTEHFLPSSISELLTNQKAVSCADFNGKVIGFYILHDNYPGRGNHIANALFAVKSEYRGNGFGRKLVEHALITAKEQGYHAMQFNSVLSTNLAAVRLYESFGFHRAGIIPQAFTKNTGETTDIYIYHRFL